MDMRLCVRQDPHLTAYIRLCLCASLPVLSVTLRVPVDDCALSLWILVHVCGRVYLSHEGRPSLGLSVPDPAHGPPPCGLPLNPAHPHVLAQQAGHTQGHRGARHEPEVRWRLGQGQLLPGSAAEY